MEELISLFARGLQPTRPVRAPKTGEQSVNDRNGIVIHYFPKLLHPVNLNHGSLPEPVRTDIHYE